MNKIVGEISTRLSELVAASPARDIEKNVRALLSSGFARLDLVTREEFEVQATLLARARERLAALENRVAALEAEAAERRDS
ncbi:MAG TPA: accessory factor UbiK family protein [Rhodocyclaceae bacterium]|nr:accessory factor UbiK family protein [Rhodocyclaceae bacterium]